MFGCYPKVAGCLALFSLFEKPRLGIYLRFEFESACRLLIIYNFITYIQRFAHKALTSLRAPGF